MDPESHDIIQTGYNGTPAGSPGCLEGACPRGRHYEVQKYPVPAGWSGATSCAYLHGPYNREDSPPGGMHGTGCLCRLDIKACACGNDLPCPDSVEPGSSYDTGPGQCPAIHSEANALIRAGKLSRGAVLYTTPGRPCDGCLKLIRGAGISEVIWPDGREVINP